MAGLDAFGTALARSDMASSPTFAEVANVTNISGPSISRSTIDVTAHDSSEAWMEFLGSLKDGGEVSMDINWDPEEATHASLVDDLDDTEPRDYKIIFPNDLAEWAFSGIMTGFEPDYPTDDKVSASVSFKVTGKPTLTLPSSSSS